MRNLVRCLFRGLALAGMACLASGLFTRSFIVLAAAAAFLLACLAISAAVDCSVLLPMERTVSRVLDAEEEAAAEESRFVTPESSRFLKRLNLAEYKFENRKRNPEAAEMIRKQTELMALQSQINPHFLYNTLDTIRGQAVMDGNRLVADMVETLSSFFRYSISGKKNMVLLQDEITHTRNYIAIQQFRFGSRFTFDLEIEEEEEEKCLNCYVPRLILQPVVENAIYHGLKDVNEGGRVSLDVALLTEELLITVSDNGQGMSVSELNELNDRVHMGGILTVMPAGASRGHTGIALPNINRRIRLLFGDDYGLTVYSSPGSGTEVEIMLPLIERAEDAWDEENAH